MLCLCNSWSVSNILVMVWRLNKSLKLAESIMSLLPHQAAQAQHQLSSLSTVYTPLVVCRWQCQRSPLSLAPNFHAKRSTPQTAGNLHLSNYTILNTLPLHARWIWPFTARPNTLNLLRVVYSTLTKIQSKTWPHFATLNTLHTWQTRSVNHHNLLCHGRKHTPAPALCWVITLLSHGNAILRVALRHPYKTIPTTHSGHVKSTNISSVGSQRSAWRRIMTTCQKREDCSPFPKLQKRGWRPAARG